MTENERKSLEGTRSRMINKRLKESIELCRSVGVPEDKILHNMDEINNFFTRKE